MGKAQDAIMITAKIYQCRQAAKLMSKMNGQDYNEMLQDYKDIILGVMQGEKLDPIHALLFISETKTYNESGLAQMLFIAALAEIMEPSEENKPTDK